MWLLVVGIVCRLKTSKQIWLDDVQCTGTESWFGACKFFGDADKIYIENRDWGRHDCTHGEDVGICCQGLLRVSTDCLKLYVLTCATSGFPPDIYISLFLVLRASLYLCPLVLTLMLLSRRMSIFCS